MTFPSRAATHERRDAAGSAHPPAPHHACVGLAALPFLLHSSATLGSTPLDRLISLAVDAGRSSSSLILSPPKPSFARAQTSPSFIVPLRPSLSTCAAQLAGSLRPRSPLSPSPLSARARSKASRVFLYPCRARSRLADPCPLLTSRRAASSDLARRSSQPALVADSSPLLARSPESRQASAARVKRAKLAAAKKAKRATTAQDEGQRLLKRHVDEVNAREGVSKRDLERRAVFARTLKRYRCGTGASLIARERRRECARADSRSCCRPRLPQGRHLAERHPDERARVLQQGHSPLHRYVLVLAFLRRLTERAELMLSSSAQSAASLASSLRAAARASRASPPAGRTYAAQRRTASFSARATTRAP